MNNKVLTEVILKTDFQYFIMYISSGTYTGGASGIGKVAALALAQQGARVIIACRNRHKAEAAINYIKQSSRNNDVFYKSLDLANFTSVRRFAEEFLREEMRLDILINNAGKSRRK